MNVTLLTAKRPSSFKAKLRKIALNRKQKTSPYLFDNLLVVCCMSFNTTPAEVMEVTNNGKLSRIRERVYVRQTIVYFLRCYTEKTYTDIGGYFPCNGKRMHHATTIHCIDNVMRLLHPRSGCREFQDSFSRVENRLKEQYEVYEIYKKK